MAGEKLKIIRKKKVPAGITLAPNVVQDSGGKPLPHADSDFGQGSAVHVSSSNIKVKPLPNPEPKPGLTTIQTDPVVQAPDRKYQTEEPQIAGIGDQTVINAERALDPAIKDDVFDADIAISKKEASRVRSEEETAIKNRIREGQLQAIEYLKKYFGAAGQSPFGPGGVENPGSMQDTSPPPPGAVVETDDGSGVGPVDDGSGVNAGDIGSGESFNTPKPPPPDSFFPEIKIPLPGIKPPHKKPAPKPPQTSAPPPLSYEDDSKPPQTPAPPPYGPGSSAKNDRRRTEMVDTVPSDLWGYLFGGRGVPRVRGDL